MATDHRLQFPLELSAEQLTLLLAALSADLAGGRWSTRRPTLLLSAAGSSGQLEHGLSVLQGDSQRLLTTVRSHLPSLRLSETEAPAVQQPPTLAVELRLTDSHRPLRVDRAATMSASILGALTSAGTGERTELRWLVSGAPTPTPARRIRANEPAMPAWFSQAPSTWHHEAEAVTQERHKQAEPLLLGVARIGAWANDQRRARQLINQVLRALASVQAPGVRLLVRAIPSGWVRRRYERNATPWVSWPLLLNAAELASLIAWPIDSPQIPGLALGAARQLAPARSISSDPAHGAVIADSTFPGLDKPVILRDQDRVMHCHVLGPTGSGKSVLLEHMAASDIRRGLGVVVIEPRGDVIDTLANLVPERRHDDVIIFNPADAAPVGYNPLQRTGSPDHLVIDQLDHIFGQLFGGNYGPRSGDLNRAALLSLAQAGRRSRPYTLAELPLLLTDAGFRHRITQKISDPTLQAFWSWYEHLGTGQSAVIAPLLNKYRAFLLREPVRNVISQANPGWSLDDVLARRQILLVRLSAGEIGEEAAQLIGSLLVAGIWQAAQRRTKLTPEQRRPVMLVVDEFQNYLRLPTSLGDMLAQARGLGLGITLANQQLGQLSASMQAEVLANARSRIVFQTNAKDARTLAPHLPGLAPEDLQHLGPYEIVAQLAVGSTLAPPLTAQTRGPAEGLGVIEAVKQQSRERYGTPVEKITADLAERWRLDAVATNYLLGEVEIAEDGEVVR